MTVVVALVAFSLSQAPTPHTLSGTLSAHVKNERFQVVTSIRGLPLGVREALQSLFGGYTLELAEPGREFQATGGVGTPILPIRRMAAAGCSMDHCLVYYERGGNPRTWYVLLYNWTPAATRLESGGLAPAGLTSITEVLKAVLSGAIKGPVKVW